MTVGRKSRSIKKVVGILSDPHPELVSLVSYPASQTPWKVIKSEDPTALRAKKAELATRAASSVVDIHEIVFSKSAFKSSEAVKTYLDDNGYENFQINESGDFWIVPGRTTEDLEDGLEDIQIGKGIKMSLGRLRPARKSEQTAAPGHVRSTKDVYDISSFASVIQNIGYLLSSAQYEAEYEGDNSPVPDKLKTWLLSGVQIFKDMANEEVQELVDRVTAQKADLERTRKSEGATQENTVANTPAPTTETPPAATPTAPVTPPAVVTTPETAPATPAPAADPAVAPTAPASPAPAAPAAGTVPPAGTATTETLAAQAETPPAAPVETPVEPAQTVTPEELTDEEKALKSSDPVGFAISRALGKVGESVAKAMTSALEPVNQSLTELREQVTKTAERVSTVETATRQTRQSGDNAEVSAPSTQAAPQQDEKARKHQERLNRDRLGF